MSSNFNGNRHQIPFKFSLSPKISGKIWGKIFCLRSHQKLSQSMNRSKFSGGACPQTPLARGVRIFVSFWICHCATPPNLNQHRVGSLEGHPDSTGEVNLEHTDISTGLSAYIHTDIQTYPDKHADIHTGISAYIHTDIPWQTHWHSHRYQCHTYIHTDIHIHIQTYPDKHADIHTGISAYIHTDIPWQTHWHSHRYQYIHTYRYTLTNTLPFKLQE